MYIFYYYYRILKNILHARKVFRFYFSLFVFAIWPIFIANVKLAIHVNHEHIHIVHANAHDRT